MNRSEEWAFCRAGEDVHGGCNLSTRADSLGAENALSSAAALHHVSAVSLSQVVSLEYLWEALRSSCY